MSSRVRQVVLIGSTAAALITAAAPSYAETESQCMQQLTDPSDSCMETNGQWSLVQGSNDGLDGGGGGGFSSGFGVLVALVILIGIGTTIWKVSTARKLATESGMDPDVATGMTLLADDGLAATYLASSLRGSRADAPPPTPASPVAARLQELKGLLDAGTITQAEYDERRKAIINSV